MPKIAFWVLGVRRAEERQQHRHRPAAECTICMDDNSTHVSVPCGHRSFRCLCGGCANQDPTLYDEHVSLRPAPCAAPTALVPPTLYGIREFGTGCVRAS